MSGRFLSAEDLLKQSKKYSDFSLLTSYTGGCKDYEPDGSWFQEKKLIKFYEEQSGLMVGRWYEDVGQVQLTANKGKFSRYVGQFRDGKHWLMPEEALFLVDQGCLQIMNKVGDDHDDVRNKSSRSSSSNDDNKHKRDDNGVNGDNHDDDEEEEEDDTGDDDDDDDEEEDDDDDTYPMSVQECYHILLNTHTSFGLNAYLVYSHLCKLGYIVIRHQGYNINNKNHNSGNNNNNITNKYKKNHNNIHNIDNKRINNDNVHNINSSNYDINKNNNDTNNINAIKYYANSNNSTINSADCIDISVDNSAQTTSIPSDEIKRDSGDERKRKRDNDDDDDGENMMSENKMAKKNVCNCDTNVKIYKIKDIENASCDVHTQQSRQQQQQQLLTQHSPQESTLHQFQLFQEHQHNSQQPNPYFPKQHLSQKPQKQPQQPQKQSQQPHQRQPLHQHGKQQPPEEQLHQQGLFPNDSIIDNLDISRVTDDTMLLMKLSSSYFHQKSHNSNNNNANNHNNNQSNSDTLCKIECSSSTTLRDVYKPEDENSNFIKFDVSSMRKKIKRIAYGSTTEATRGHHNKTPPSKFRCCSSVNDWTTFKSLSTTERLLLTDWKVLWQGDNGGEKKDADGEKDGNAGGNEGDDNDDDGCDEVVRPLICPGGVNNLDLVYRSLDIIKSATTPAESFGSTDEKMKPERPMFDVYQPNSTFKRSKPGTPHMLVCLAKRNLFFEEILQVMKTLLS
ncbi:hypothetical protein HELRODRAFT_192222 [Helobdella robusta]|uniref:tRNA-splicing endonuclease subunit Sen54 N-terminal domain-containing protein n=1 Tax=Helobdella robusta TaxID=6412 RepID=T1FTQ5_HELRO|nr:hypothetical protein HELRODRAFT_192222 [Helobdella robusta]ESO01645.1 hypothetical protein HELRODRAFT_192222 [Helobdella robusta]